MVDTQGWGTLPINAIQTDFAHLLIGIQKSEKDGCLALDYGNPDSINCLLPMGYGVIRHQISDKKSQLNPVQIIYNELNEHLWCTGMLKPIYMVPYDSPDIKEWRSIGLINRRIVFRKLFGFDSFSL